jgi:hypothetical protein
MRKFREAGIDIPYALRDPRARTGQPGPPAAPTTAAT